MARWVPGALSGRLVASILVVAGLVAFITIVITNLIVFSDPAGARVPSELYGVAHISAVVTALLATTIGALAGLWLARVSRQPVEAMADRVEEAGERVLEGHDYASAPVRADPALPQEFSDLALSVDDVLKRLAERQAELRDAVRKAQTAEEALGAVVSGSVDAQVLLDGDTVVLANPATALAFGIPAETMAGASIYELLRGRTVLMEDGSPFERGALVPRALAEPVTIRIEREGVAPTFFVVRATRPHDSEPARVVVTVRDITEERRTQSIRSEIVELVTHDLRAPLTVVSGYLDVLRRPLSDGERERVVDAAKRDAERMADLLEDVLSAAKAEELLAPSVLEPVSVTRLATEVVDAMRTAHPVREIRAEVHGECEALGDEKRLRQALVNLVTNAVKYSPDDTPIEVAVSCPGPRVSLSVADHGPGIPESERETIFDRYARLENGNGSRSGLGLGLYIVRIIAESHGGCARVEETPGGGATFVIELPRATTATVPAAELAAD